MFKDPEGNKNWTTMKIVAITVALALLFGGVAGAGFQTAKYIAGRIIPDSSPGTDQNDDSDGITEEDVEKIIETGDGNTVTVTDVSSVVKAVMPSVVSIKNTTTVTEQYRWGPGRTYESQSAGSGIIIGKNDSELLVVTNNHVIEGVDSMSVTFIDEQSYEALLKGADPNHDLAVIAIPLSGISESTLNQIKIAELGDSDKLIVGETAIAIGNALGYGQSVTAGVISALHREVTVNNVTFALIQTDAAINPGNSGGALLNIRGEVIGINAVKFSSSDVEGMGYAIPISTAIPVIDELELQETKVKVAEAEQGYLAIQTVDVTAEIAATYNIPMGVFVAAVENDSLAEDAGIQKGDIITSIDGNSITTKDRLDDKLEYYKAGTEVVLTIQRAADNVYEEIAVKVTLDEKPAN
ncbi:S1C family serine protease [Anaerobium acetethylicum]|uniref:Serine protease Do n=1 Tax=Anaerobium acetethylicum TaxID=1619234 RepID=A0A1D3TXJ5_9FIRM|nr:trypsin-like peptidase domain-containing protein [Anaerobium acetethylicum]SCP99041.1 serine protease Do [Anaerobium acetethylicum]